MQTLNGLDAFILLSLAAVIALVIFAISVVKHRGRVGRWIAIGLILLSSLGLIEYFELQCQDPRAMCELIGFLYILLAVEALILILVFLGLSTVVQKLLRR
jgi:hypothetical protein